MHDWLKVLPFLHAPQSEWGAGAGIVEYSFYTVTQGLFPWFLLGLLGLFGLFTGRIFCGWVCPTGFIQDLFSGLADENKKFSINFDKTLKSVKYFILVMMIIIIGPLGIIFNTNVDQYANYKESLGLLGSQPLWPVSLSEFIFVTFPTAIQSLIETVQISQIFDGFSPVQIIIFFFYLLVLILSVFWPRIYCRYGCPYGAAVSIFSRFSLLKLKRLPTRCPGRKECGICEQVCPKQIRILDEPFEGFTGKGECNLCLKCMEKCPHDAIKWKFGI